MQHPDDNPYDQPSYDAALPYTPYNTEQPREAAPSDSQPVHSSETSFEQPYTESVNYVDPARYYADEPTLYAAPPVPPLFLDDGKVQPRRRSNRVLWSILGALVAIVILSVGLFSVYNYVNRPTPVKTLDTFCKDLVSEDYMQAYNQLSKDFQGNISETDFANLLSQDKVVTCTHGTANESGNSTTTSLKLVHSSQGINDDKVTLTKDSSNNWKINDLQKA